MHRIAIDPLKILQKYYKENEKAYLILLEHSLAVAVKAVEIALKNLHLNPDVKFIYEASVLHDIGILFTNSPEIGCYGNFPYIAHGYLGREILEKEGMPEHALVCERHIGVGLSRDYIISSNLPVPQRDMLPVSIEEKIICVADKFFSKSATNLSLTKNLKEIDKSISRYGADKLQIFYSLLEELSLK